MVHGRVSDFAIYAFGSIHNTGRSSDAYDTFCSFDLFGGGGSKFVA
jgi:hypothetical protein